VHVCNPREDSIASGRERFVCALTVLARSKQLPPGIHTDALRDAVHFDTRLPPAQPAFVLEIS
jgi:hypothetical protein